MWMKNIFINLFFNYYRLRHSGYTLVLPLDDKRKVFYSRCTQNKMKFFQNKIENI